MYKVGINLSLSFTDQDIQDITLRLHSVLTKMGIHAYIDRSLQSVIALEHEVTIAFFASRLGKAILNMQIDCLESRECFTKLDNLVSLSNLIIKELGLVTVNNVEYAVKRELIYEDISEINLNNIDQKLRHRGFLRISSSRKDVDLGLKTGKLLTYKYKYIDSRLNPILIDIIYILRRSGLNITIVTCLTLTRLPVTSDFLIKLMSLSDVVLAIIQDSLKG